MDLSGNRAAAVIATVAVAGAILGGAVVYLATRSKQPAQAPQPRADQTSTPDATETPSPPATSTPSEEPTMTPGETTGTAGSDATRSTDVLDQPTLVVDWSRSGDRIRLALDYIQLLYGDDANREAARRGLEVPVPNDYLIVNDNPRLRVFPVNPGIMVHVLYNDDGTMTYEGRDISLDAWYSRLTGPLTEQYSGSYFLVTVRDGEITRIAQQYTP